MAIRPAAIEFGDGLSRVPVRDLDQQDPVGGAAGYQASRPSQVPLSCRPEGLFGVEPGCTPFSTADIGFEFPLSVSQVPGAAYALER